MGDEPVRQLDFKYSLSVITVAADRKRQTDWWSGIDRFDTEMVLSSCVFLLVPLGNLGMSAKGAAKVDKYGIRSERAQ